MTIVDTLVVTALALVLLLLGGRTLLLARQGVKVWRISSRQRLAGKLLEAAFVPLLLVWLALVFLETQDHARLGPLFWQSRLLAWLGLIVCYLALCLFFWSLLSFGRAWRIGIDEQHSDELVTTGAFAVSRNPIFVFLDAFYGGNSCRKGIFIFNAVY